MKEAGRAVPEAIRRMCKEFWSLKVRRDGLVGLGPLFRSVKKRASFFEYVEAGLGAILPNIVSPFRVWHELWLAGIPVCEARLSAMGKEASGLAIAPTLSRVPIFLLGVVDQGGVSPWHRLLQLPPTIGQTRRLGGPGSYVPGCGRRAGRQGHTPGGWGR
jgi:hypothetical protein